MFLTRLKMNYAAELLMKKHLSVKEAANAVSFFDPYHFSRVFKKIHGISPSKYLELMSGNSSGNSKK